MCMRKSSIGWRRSVHTEKCLNKFCDDTFTLQQARQPLWEFGTQPIMLLVAYRQWEELEWEWNVDGEKI